MSFPARFAGKCATCSQPLLKGQYITSSRHEKGKAYHANCEKPSEVPTKDVSVPSFSPATIPATNKELMAQMIKMLETMGKPVPVPDPPIVVGFDSIEPIEPKDVVEVSPRKRITKVASPGTISDNAPWHDVLSILHAGIQKDGGLFRILIIGPPGTGKSTTAIKVTDTKHRVTMTEGSGVEDLIGMYQLKAGETVWSDGPVTSAMREGAPVLIDEIDHHSTEIGSLLYAVLDDNPQIMLPTGEAVFAQPGYGVIATTNSNVTALPEAILDRFEAVMVAKDPHPASMDELNDSMRGAVVSYFRSLEATPWAWSGKPTVRRMRAYARMIPILSVAHAGSLAFGT